MQKSKGSGMVNFVPSFEREGLEFYHDRVLKLVEIAQLINNEK